MFMRSRWRLRQRCAPIEIMKSCIDNDRRRLVVSSAGVTAALVTGGLLGCTGDAPADRQLRFGSLAAAGEELARLARARELVSSTAWGWPQTLLHCAQSIEYSMTGFPRSNSRLFQDTIGSAALGFFSWRGRISHDLSEPIPGAPALAASADPAPALERLRASMRAFESWSKPLLPHFAYGELSRQQYELAHAMHLANHLSAFRIKS
jgi:Protein of unknown function (DUF1569)